MLFVGWICIFEAFNSSSRVSTIFSASAIRFMLSSQRGDSGKLKRRYQASKAPAAPKTITHRQPLMRKCVGTRMRASNATVGTAVNPAT